MLKMLFLSNESTAYLTETTVTCGFVAVNIQPVIVPYDIDCLRHSYFRSFKCFSNKREALRILAK